MDIQLQDKTLGQWMEHWAETTPDKEYLVYSDRDLRFTWKEFNERVDRMAKGMLSIGIKHGTHVGIWATNVPDWLTFLYAAAKIGAVAVTVNTNYKQSELEFLVENADIHTLCITDGVFDGSYVDMVYTMLPELKESQRGYLKSKRFPVLKNVVYIGQEKYRGMYNTPELLLLGENVSDETLVEAKKLVTPHDVVNMQYTSGTTGFPKGVMLTHYNIARRTHEIHGRRQTMLLRASVPLLRCRARLHERLDAWMHTSHGRKIRSAGRTRLHPQGTVHGPLRRSDHVHRRAQSPDVQHVRPDLPPHRHHGRLPLPCGTDEAGGRKNVHARDQRIRVDGSIARHDTFANRRSGGSPLQYGRP